jgi:hypothetical protein
MNITRQKLIDKVNAKDFEWFYEMCYEDNHPEVQHPYEMNYGDGNEYIICLYFPNHNLYVQLEGTYSSWDSPHWESVNFAMPYEFKETRYKTATLDYIRDQKLNDILGEKNDLEGKI